MSETTRVVAGRTLRADAVATRQRIIDDAIELARREPFGAITMRDIARAAGVSTATAYTYFASKEHVFAEAYLDGVRTLTESVRARPPAGDTASYPATSFENSLGNHSRYTEPALRVRPSFCGPCRPS